MANYVEEIYDHILNFKFKYDLDLIGLTVSNQTFMELYKKDCQFNFSHIDAVRKTICGIKFIVTDDMPDFSVIVADNG